jgi:hypothetical protein
LTWPANGVSIWLETLKFAAVSLATNMAIILAKQLEAEARGPFILELEGEGSRYSYINEDHGRLT